MMIDRLLQPSPTFLCGVIWLEASSSDSTNA
jgi:hypothetical protein